MGTFFLHSWVKLKRGAPNSARFHDWLLFVRHIVLSRLIETLTSFLMKRRGAWNISGLEFLQCAAELCSNQSIIHLGGWLCYGHAAKWEWAGRAVSTHFTQELLTGEIKPLNVDFIFLWCAGGDESAPKWSSKPKEKFAPLTLKCCKQHIRYRHLWDSLWHQTAKKMNCLHIYK